MKIITIGRGDNNDIILHDDNDIISRQHATLRVYDSGKMEIISTGINGTFLNGHPIKPNVPHRVKREDVVSFAHIRQLDWALIPNPLRKYKLIGGALLAVAVIALIAYAISSMSNDNPVPPIPPTPSNPVVVSDEAQEKEKTENSESKDINKKEIEKMIEEFRRKEQNKQKKKEKRKDSIDKKNDKQKVEVDSVTDNAYIPII